VEQQRKDDFLNYYDNPPSEIQTYKLIPSILTRYVIFVPGLSSNKCQIMHIFIFTSSLHPNTLTDNHHRESTIHDNDDIELDVDSEQTRAMYIICSPTLPLFERQCSSVSDVGVG
jgi:hypothetical protein